MAKIAFYTLGCRSNQYETDRMARSASASGFEVVPYPGPADIYVINTCTVTSAAEKKSRHIIRHAKKKNPGSKVIVTGCAVERAGFGIEEIDLIVKNKDKLNIIEFIGEQRQKNRDKRLETRDQKIETRNQGQENRDKRLEIKDKKEKAVHANIFSNLRSPISNLISSSPISDPVSSSPISDLASSSPISDLRSHPVRSNLMVEDGCENFCSYCIVPYVRGKIKSKPIDEIISEVKQMVKDGVKEIVLTGINLGEFKVSNDQIPSAKQNSNSEFKSSPISDLPSPISDLPSPISDLPSPISDLSSPISDLSSLIDTISKIDGLLRIRLSSIEPMYVTDELIKAAKENPKVCEHFHIPLQSGDDGILKAMNRNYTTKDFLDIAKKIREQIKDAAITTDIIVGFPGEDEQAFKNTLKLVDKIQFSRIHIFPYSDRPGTKAQKLPHKVDPRIIVSRQERLDKLREQLMLKFHRSFKDQRMEILVEQRDRKTGALEGLTSNYIRVFLCASPRANVVSREGDDTGDESIGSLISVKFRDLQGENVIARPILV